MNKLKMIPDYVEMSPSPPINENSLSQESPPILSTQNSVVNDFGDGHYRMNVNFNWPMTSSDKLVATCNYTMKAELTNYHRRLDNAFPLLQADHPKTIRHGFEILKQVVSDAWGLLDSGAELVDSICCYLQTSGNLDLLIQYFVSGQFDLRLQVGKLLEAYLSNKNVAYILQKGYLREMVRTIIYEVDKKDEEHMCLGMSLLESMFRSGEACKMIVEFGGLTYLLDVCRTQMSKEALLHAAVAISNLALFSDTEVHRLMVQKQVPLWLFMLALNEDKRIEYYSCLSCCILAANKEFERPVKDSGTLQLVGNYLKTSRPEDTAKMDYKFRSGRSKEWLTALIPLLSSSLGEVQALALYQLCMEASLRKGTDRTNVMIELGLICKIQEIAACPKTDIVAIYAEKLLNELGEPIPFKLSLAMPLWTCKDVQYWVRKVGFSQYAESFAKHRVDGDLLLRTTESHLKNEIQMASAYERMRFIRELNSMKRCADYSTVDPSRLDIWLTRFDSDLSVYTYQMLTKGLERQSLLHVNDAILKEECGMDNCIHRMKLLSAFKEVKHVEEAEMAMLRRQVDIFISYRRSTGNQLASLLKVHLQLKGFKVFIDVDRLNAGQFDKSLLLNIKAAKHFILVLSPNALDGCIGDDDTKDWLHLEIKTALESKVNVVPVFERGFEWPQNNLLPSDIQHLCSFNSIQWVHEYQDACIEKLHRFLSGQFDITTYGSQPMITE